MIRSFGRQSIVVWAFPLMIAKGAAEELKTFGQLYHLSGASAKRRANELLSHAKVLEPFRDVLPATRARDSRTLRLNGGEHSFKSRRRGWSESYVKRNRSRRTAASDSGSPSST